jgi:ABC-type Fe3+-hydroxamate transport system substrate-binding protein
MSPLSRRSFIVSSGLLSLIAPRLASAQSASPSTGERVIEHVGGTTTLTGDPKRIVVLEWYLVEELLAAGIQPVGVADIEGFRSLVTIPLELSQDALDVGTRQEPSLESIAAAEPDLILADDGRHEMIYQQLSEIAPTILVPFDDRSDDIAPLDDLHNRVTLVGEAINQPDAAQKSLETMETALQEQTARLADAGLAGIQFAIASWYTNNIEPTLRMFSNQHIVGDAVAALGIENVWPDNGEEVGFSTVSFEGLVDLPAETHFLFIPTEDGGFADLLENDPILTSLPFVQEGRAYGLPHDTWTNPGTLGIVVLITRVVDALTGTAE